MAQAKISNLSEFLRQSGAKYRVFDLGRRVKKIPADVFEQIENAQLPYPAPFQRTALFGIIFWHPKAETQHYIWFLQMPLDEQGLLLQSARDEFLVMVLERVGESMLAAADGQKIQGALKDSPYTFKPREDKMAAFNAQATYQLKLPPSLYYQNAYQYFTGQQNKDNWQQLAMQGVADFAIRMNDADTALAVAKYLPELPPVPLQTLSQFLENAEPPTPLVETFANQLSETLKAPATDQDKVVAYLRAVSNAPAQGLLNQMVEQTLRHDCSQDIEVLAVIAGRCWQALKQPDLASLFCEQLAQNNAGQAAFSHLLADLLFIPDMREPMMQALRSPERSEALSVAVGEMFGS
ncbi:MAG: DUF3549 family protein [Methylophaga sp.]